MSKKRSDALTALVAEVVDIRRDEMEAEHFEETARVEYVAANEALENARRQRRALTGRLEVTRNALTIIQQRDDISDETVEALLERAK